MARRRSRRRYKASSFSRGYVGGNFEIQEAVRKLREKGEHVLTAAKRALLLGAYDIVDDAKSRCPVKTGKLRDSIKAVKLEDGAAYEISADARNDYGVPYGQFVEFSPFGTPFLFPALDANRNVIKNAVKTAIQEAISQG